MGKIPLRPMDEHRVFTVEEQARLDVFVSGWLGLTRSAVQRMIRQGDIQVNGKQEKPGHVVNAGDHVEAILRPPKPAQAMAEDIPISIIYEDSDLAVVDKPQGMVVHPAPGHEDGTLVNGLLYRLSDLSGIGGQMRPGIVHRIDRMTSGLLVVAKNDATHQALSDQFRDHSARRGYMAIAEGNFKEDSGTVDAPIGRHPVDRKRMAVNPRGRSAVTHWTVVARMKECALIKLELETGRTHQIRVHMASIGHPLCGDTVYGRAKPRFGLVGQALHGYELTFVHPANDERLTFYAPIPEYFMDALKTACSASPQGVVWNILLDGVLSRPQGSVAEQSGEPLSEEPVSLDGFTQENFAKDRFIQEGLLQNGETLLECLKRMPQRRKEIQS